VDKKLLVTLQRPADAATVRGSGVEILVEYPNSCSCAVGRAAGRSLKALTQSPLEGKPIPASSVTGRLEWEAGAIARHATCRPQSHRLLPRAMRWGPSSPVARARDRARRIIHGNMPSSTARGY
jgi:hypothetical protein